MKYNELTYTTQTEQTEPTQVDEMGPELIPDFTDWIDNESLNQQKTQKVLRDRKSQVLRTFGDDVVLIKQGHKYSLIDTKTGLTVYRVVYDIKYWSMLGISTATQILIYKYKQDGDYTPPYTSGIAKTIFWDYILPQTQGLMTDSLQSKGGRDFWRYRVQEAFVQNLNVYYVNFDSRSVIRISDEDEFNSLLPELWGTGKKFRNRRLVITPIELKTKEPK